ncbi:MAG TPA: hypothetical protein DCX06_05555 [Opitutae bacterium]|nr:hypothetical protein [Opitutae bacterium]
MFIVKNSLTIGSHRVSPVCMTTDTNNNKKLKRMGIALIIIAALSFVFFSLFALLLTLMLTIVPREEFDEILTVLPEGIQASDSIATLQSADLAFFETQTSLMTVSAIFGVIVFTSITYFLFRIGLAWKRKETFTKPVISSIHWIGVISILNAIVTFCLSITASESPGSQAFGHTFLYDLIIYGGETNGLGNLSTGLLLIALGWVLKHGQALKEEHELTV